MIEIENLHIHLRRYDEYFSLILLHKLYTNQINHDPISCLYYKSLNKSITNIETDSSTNRKIFSIDQLIQYIPIG